MASFIIKLITKIISSKFFIGLIFDTKIPSGSMNFQVGYATLQIKKALSRYIKDHDNILDLGTGALAVISIWLKKNNKNINVTASDLYDDVVKNAIKVVNFNKVDVKVIKSDLLKNIKGKFDLIVFNPPLHPKITYKLVDRFLKQAPRTRIILSSNKYYINLKKLESVIKTNNYEFESVVSSIFNPAKAYVIRKSSKP